MTHGFERKLLKEPKDDKVIAVLAKRLGMVASGHERGEVIVAALQLAVDVSKPEHMKTLATCLEEVAAKIRRGEIK